MGPSIIKVVVAGVEWSLPVGALVRVLVIHNSPLLFEGVRTVLARANEIEVVGEAGDAAQALLRCSQIVPDVAVVDASLVHGQAGAIVEQLAKLCQGIRVVVIVDSSRRHAIRQALLLTAQGFVARESPTIELVNAVRAVVSGQRYITSCFVEQLATMMRHLPGDADLAADAGYDGLSKREREVFRMLAAGMSNKEIAFALGIGRKTVEKHHLRVLRKLHIGNSMELIRYAAHIGIVDLERDGSHRI